MASIGDLAVNITAKTGQLEAQLDKTEAHINSFGGKLEATLAGAAAGLGASVAIAAIGTAAQKTSEFVGHLAEHLDQIAQRRDIGISAGLGAHDFEGLTAASGLDAREIAEAMSQFNAQIGQALAGNEGAKNKLEGIGLSLEKLRGGPMAALRELADKTAEAGNAFAQANISGTALGEDGGRKLLGFLSKGSKGIDDLVTSADKMGLVLSDADSAAAKLADQSLHRLALAGNRVWDAMAIKAAPSLAVLADEAVSVLPKILLLVDALDSAARKALRFAASAAALTGSFGVSIALNDFLKKMEEFDDKALRMSMRKPQAPAALSGGEDRKALDKLLADAEKFTSAAMSPLEKFEGELSKLDQLMMKGAIAWGTYGDAAGKAALALEAATHPGRNILEQYEGAVARIKDHFKDATSAVEKFQEKLALKNLKSDFDNKAAIEAERIQQSVQSPVEKFMERSRLLDQLPLDERTRKLAIGDERSKAMAALGLGQGNLAPKAITKGSAEEYSFLTRKGNATREGNEFDRMVAETKKQTEAIEEMKQVIEKVLGGFAIANF